MEFAEAYIFDKEKEIGALKEHISNLGNDSIESRRNIERLNNIIQQLKEEILRLESDIQEKDRIIKELKDNYEVVRGESGKENEKLMSRLNDLEKEVSKNKA